MERVTIIAMEEERGLVHGAAPVIVTGIGAVNVLAALDDLDRDTPLLNIGYAGSKAIGVGEHVRIGKVALHHPNAEYDEREFMLDGDIPCYTSSDFVVDSDAKEPCVYDMELAYILAMGFTDVVAEKVVSDGLDAAEYEESMRG